MAMRLQFGVVGLLRAVLVAVLVPVLWHALQRQGRSGDRATGTGGLRLPIRLSSLLAVAEQILASASHSARAGRMMSLTCGPVGMAFFPDEKDGRRC